MNIGNLISKPLYDSRKKEHGEFILPLEMDKATIESARDPKALIKAEISRIVTEQCFVHGLSPDAWRFEFTPYMAKIMGYATLNFDMGFKQ